jgi:hypothetical protein
MTYPQCPQIKSSPPVPGTLRSVRRIERFSVITFPTGIMGIVAILFPQQLIAWPVMDCSKLGADQPKYAACLIFASGRMGLEEAGERAESFAPAQHAVPAASFRPAQGPGEPLETRNGHRSRQSDSVWPRHRQPSEAPTRPGLSLAPGPRALARSDRPAELPHRRPRRPPYGRIIAKSSYRARLVLIGIH